MTFKKMSAPISVILLLAMVANGAIGQSVSYPNDEVQTCLLYEADPSRGLAEVCKYQGTSLWCKANNESSIFLRLKRCSEIFDTNILKYCLMDIKLDIFSAHQPIKNGAFCSASNSSLTVNVNELARNDRSIVEASGITSLKLKGNSRSKHLWSLEHIGKIVSDLKYVENLVIESIGEDKNSIVQDKSVTMHFSNLNTFRLSDVQVTNLRKNGIQLSSVRDVHLSDLEVLDDFGSDSIIWKFEMPCRVVGTVNFLLDNLRFHRVSKKPIRIINNCPNSDLRMNISVKRIDYPEVLSSDIYREILMSPIDNRFTEFTSEPIRCCAEENRWLFKPDVRTYPGLKLNVPCVDLRSPLQNYNETGRDAACKQQPGPLPTPAPYPTPSPVPPSSSLPTQLIVIGLIALLILILVAIFIYLRIRPAGSKGRAQLRSPRAASPPPAPLKESVSIPSSSIPSSGPKVAAPPKQPMMAKSAKSTTSIKNPANVKSTKSTKSAKSTKSNWSTKRIGKARSRRTGSMSSPSAIRSVRSS